MLARLLLALAVTALTVSACDRSPSTGPSAHSATSPASPNTPASPATSDVQTEPAEPAMASGSGNGCEVAQSGADVRIQLPTAEQPFCAEMAKNLSGGGEFWTVRTQQSNTPHLQVVCAMTSPDNTATVLDTGSAFIGRAVCARMLQTGWEEDVQKEEEVAGAQASAAAAAAEAQRTAQANNDEALQLARDSDTVDAALTVVKEWPARLTEDLGKVDAALTGVSTALAQTRTDAADGQGEDCYNVQTVTYDAEQSVGYEVTQGVGYAATQDVGADIDTARADITKMETALATLTTHPNGQAPAGVDDAKATLRRAIAAAVTHTSDVIDTANANAATAYSIARKLATGNCSNDGPGSREAVAHIK